MIRFIDITTGRTFNGDQPFVHWFEGQQSIGLIYNQNIYIISDQANLKFKLDDTTIFHIIDPAIQTGTDITVNDFIYKSIPDFYKDEITLNGTAYNNRYVYCLNLAACSDNALEARVELQIDNLSNQEDTLEGVYLVGADFHDEREELKINLGNQGFEVPESVQKAIYDSNIHEEGKDNILLNRKYKELLLDFMKIIGNRGSYLSLTNSLNWFEYGDLLKIHEYWKHTEWERLLYNDHEFKQILYKQLQTILTNYSKTTYIGIYCAYEHEDGNETVTPTGGEQFLAEPNPALVETTFKWSVVDMALKMAVLGNFFETYFMPIHLDLLMCTMEDIVYTESVKVVNIGKLDREDYFIHNQPICCSVKNGDQFLLQNVNGRAKSTTPFANNTIPANYDDHVIIGIEDLPGNPPIPITDDTLKAYMVNHFNGVGASVPFTYTIEVGATDVIYREDIIIGIKNPSNTFTTVRHTFGHRYTPVDGKITITFNLLCTQDTDYDFRIQFFSTSGQTYVHRVTFSVIDTFRSTLELYRLMANEPDKIGPANKYMFEHQLEPTLDLTKRLHSQYIPTTIESGDGARTSLVILMKAIWDDTVTIEAVVDEDILAATGLTPASGNPTFAEQIASKNGQLPAVLVPYENVLSNKPIVNAWIRLHKRFTRYTRDGYNSPSGGGTRVITKRTYQFISNKFTETEEDIRTEFLDKYQAEIVTKSTTSTSVLYGKDVTVSIPDITRVYIPYFHHLEEFKRETEASCHISEGMTLCVIPNLRYLKYITEPEWVFHNASTDKDFNLPSIQEPLILSNERATPALPNGYYDVIFRYKLSATEDEVHEISLSSAFIKD